MTSLRFPRTRRRLALGAIAAVPLVALGVPAIANAAPTAATYNFSEHRDHADVTFNQLLAINDSGQIAGYYGSGADPQHPNVGYVLSRPYAQSDFSVQNFPGGVQTQVTAINNSGNTGGFYADANGDNYGFVRKGGIYTVVIDPATTGNMNQVLGINNKGLAAGFYTDAKGNAHGYIFNFHDDTFSPVNVPGASAVTASGVNNRGDITGFETDAGGSTVSFVRYHGGKLVTLSAPGASATTAFGINNEDEVVGSYTVGKSPYGFTWSNGTFATVNAPGGTGSTVVNGVNNDGAIVGFYTDGAGNTDGFLGTPRS